MKRTILLALTLLLLGGLVFAKKSRNAKNEILGHEDTSASVSKGIVRLDGLGENGSVIYYISNLRGGYIPVNDKSNFADSTFIALYVDGEEFRLNKSKKVSFAFSAEDDVLAEKFTVRGTAELEVTYAIDGDDAVIISYVLRNTSGKAHDFALKSVYNTKLGENRRSHYSTSKKNDVYNEEIVIPSPDESWIISSDGKYAVEFDIFGKDISAPQRVVMANCDIMKNATPRTEFKAGRAFDSLLSYNDSSLGLFWEGIRLEPEESKELSHRIRFSTNDFQNAGNRFSAAEPAPDEAASEKEGGAAQESLVPLEEKKPSEEAAEPEKNEAGSESAPQPENEKDDRNYEFNTDTGGIDSSRLNAEYVQQLINYINSLEQSDPSLNRMKIQQLQTEVDEVLQILRGRN